MVLPAFEEGAAVNRSVRRVRDEVEPVVGAGQLELIVVDDGSSDDTAAQARSGGADRVLVQERNRGKGAAVRAGVLAARGRTVAFTDADLAYAPHHLVAVLDAVEAGWDAVVGSRRHTSTQTLVRARLLRDLGGRVINLMTRLVLDGDYGDTQCGLKGFRSDVARILFSHARIDGFAFDVELFHLVERHGLSLVELPVRVSHSSTSSVQVVRDGLQVVRDLARIRRLDATGVYDLTEGERRALFAPEVGSAR